MFEGEHQATFGAPTEVLGLNISEHFLPANLHFGARMDVNLEVSVRLAGVAPVSPLLAGVVQLLYR